jgi:hypothetical protein
MTKRTMQMIACELYAELVALKARAPMAIGNVGTNGVDGDVSVATYPRQRTISCYFDRNWFAALTREQAEKLIAQLRAGAHGIPIATASAP